MAHKQGSALAQRARLERRAPRREGVRGRDGPRRRDHRPPARHGLPPRRRGRHRPRPRPLRDACGTVVFQTGRRGRVVSVAPVSTESIPMAASGGWAMHAGRAIAAGRVAAGSLAARTGAHLARLGRRPRPRGRGPHAVVDVRDLVMDGIALHTVDHPQFGPRWVATCALADAVDAGASYAARRALPPSAPSWSRASPPHRPRRARRVGRAAQARRQGGTRPAGADRDRAQGPRPGPPDPAVLACCSPPPAHCGRRTRRSTGRRRRSGPSRVEPRAAQRARRRAAPRFPVTLLWGPEFVLLYNEAFVDLIADKHPRALGTPARDVFPEAWDVVGPMMHSVFEGRGRPGSRTKRCPSS